MYLLLVAFAVVPFIVAVLLYTRHKLYLNNRPCNGPPGLPIIGTLATDFKNKERYLDYLGDLKDEYGSEIFLSNLFMEGVLLLQPEDVKHILYSNNKNYTRQGMNKNYFWFKWLGAGIFNAWGANWKEQRKTARPLFHKLVLKEMMPQFRENARKVIDILNDHVKSGKAIDIQDLYFRYTLDTFGKLGFGEDLNSLRSKPEFASCFDKTQEFVASSFTNPFLIYTGKTEFEKCIATIEKAVYGFISDRRKLPREELLKRKDLLSRFMCLRDDDGEPYSDKYLRDIFMNFLIAGRDTTAVLMSWFTYCIALNPKCLKEIEKEIDMKFPNNIEPDSAVYQDMPVLRNTIQETLRMYPPVPLNGRFAINDDVLPSGVKIKAGLRARTCTYLMHRDKEWWSEPNTFKPERWEDPNLLKHPFQFVPFHAGPQICLGKGLALMEAKTLLIMIFQRFKIQLSPEHLVVPKAKVILFSKTGIKVNVSKRL